MKILILSLYGKHYEKILISLDQSIVSGSNFFIGLLISKLLGLEELGIYAFVWLLLMMSSSLMQNFISIPMINKYIGLNNLESKIYIVNVFLLQLLSATIFSVVIYLLLIFPLNISFFKTLSENSSSIPLLIFSYLMQDFMRRLFILNVNLKKLLLSDIFVNGGQVCFLLFYLNGSKIEFNMLLLFFAFTYMLGFVFGIERYFLSKHSIQKIIEIVKHHWHIAKWLLASAILQWFAGNYFIVSAGNFLGTESAGIIRIAQSIVGIMNIFFIALEFYVPGKAILIFSKYGREYLLNYMFKLSVVGFLICLLFSITIIFTAENLLSILYGVDYIKYSSIIIYFSFFYIIVFLGYPMRFILRAMNKMKDMFWAYLFATIFSLLMAEYMIKKFDIWGVVLGLAISQLIMQGWYIRAIINSKYNLK